MTLSDYVKFEERDGAIFVKARGLEFFVDDVRFEMPEDPRRFLRPGADPRGPIWEMRLLMTELPKDTPQKAPRRRRRRSEDFGLRRPK